MMKRHRNEFLLLFFFIFYDQQFSALTVVLLLCVTFASKPLIKVFQVLFVTLSSLIACISQILNSKKFFRHDVNRPVHCLKMLKTLQNTINKHISIHRIDIKLLKSIFFFTLIWYQIFCCCDEVETIQQHRKCFALCAYNQSPQNESTPVLWHVSCN